MKKKSRLWLNEYVYVGVFALVIAMIFIAPFLDKGYLVYGDDLHYHLSRIKEISGWLKDGVFNFPGISTRSFYSLGYGVNIFYPWLTLLPFSILGLLLKNPTNAIYVGFYFYTFVTVLIAYGCMKKFSRSWVSSTAFSILYTFSIYRTIDGITRFALAEFIALTFFPLLLLGIYEVLFGKKRYWPLVTIGFSLIVYTHVLSAFLACIYLIVFWGVSLFFIEERVKRSLLLLFSGVVSIFASAGYLFGFIEEQMFQTFLQPSPMKLAGKEIGQLVVSSFSSDLMQSSMGGVYNIGYTCILILLLGVFFLKEMSKTYKIIYSLGVITFFMTTSLFPWSLMQGTFLSVIQFPFRLMIFPTLFACLTGANLIKNVSEKYSFKIKRSILIITLLVCVAPWLLSANAMMDRAARFGFDTGDIFFNDSDNRSSMWIDQYMPKSSQKYVDDIYNHVGYLNSEAVTFMPKSEKQSTSFSIKTDEDQSKVDLPVVRYKNTTIFVNGKKVKVTSSHRGTVQLLIAKGVNKISIEYEASLIIKLGVLISIITWLILIVYLVLYSCQKNESSHFVLENST